MLQDLDRVVRKSVEKYGFEHVLNVDSPTPKTIRSLYAMNNPSSMANCAIPFPFMSLVIWGTSLSDLNLRLDRRAENVKHRLASKFDLGILRPQRRSR